MQQPQTELLSMLPHQVLLPCPTSQGRSITPNLELWRHPESLSDSTSHTTCNQSPRPMDTMALTSLFRPPLPFTSNTTFVQAFIILSGIIAIVCHCLSCLQFCLSDLYKMKMCTLLYLSTQIGLKPLYGSPLTDGVWLSLCYI